MKGFTRFLPHDQLRLRHDFGYTPVMQAIVPALRRFSWVSGKSWKVKAGVMV